MGSLVCLFRAGRRLDRAHGFVTMGFVLAVGFSMLFFVLLANLLAVQYGRGVVRAALDEGARHGARYGAGAAECETRIQRYWRGCWQGRWVRGCPISALVRQPRPKPWPRCISPVGCQEFQTSDSRWRRRLLRSGNDESEQRGGLGAP